MSVGELSALQLCSDMIDHVSSQNPRIKAYSDVIFDSAMREAEKSDHRRVTGSLLSPLDGVPIAVKDLIDTTPARCKAGLTHLSEYRPRTDARVVRSLREAGAVIVGVTETDNGAFGTRTESVINPIAPDRIVGGSSGGSGAAVAAGMAYAALGTDTGGSIRIPAACCSIAGFKPTWDRIGMAGVRPLARSLDHVGPLARSVTDLKVMQSIIDAADANPADSVLPPMLRFGFSDAYSIDADANIQAAMGMLKDLLNAMRQTTCRVVLPSPDQVMSFHMVNLPREAAAYHQSNFPYEWGTYAEIARSTIEMGLSLPRERHSWAERERDAARSVVDQNFEFVDVIVVPVLPMDVPLRNAERITLAEGSFSVLEATVRYTALFNQTGHPVVSLPIQMLPDGRALSAQLVGPRNSDRLLLDVAQRLEEMLALRIDYASLGSLRQPQRTLLQI
jgi:aspartyl-tRNA(Asn)/glutamyl-tRNA(Gln) amidotransferase subunit A